MLVITGRSNTVILFLLLCCQNFREETVQRKDWMLILNDENDFLTTHGVFSKPLAGENRQDYILHIMKGCSFICPALIYILPQPAARAILCWSVWRA